MKKVRARYRAKNGNPFDPLFLNTAKIDGEAPDEMTMKELEEFARARTPKGHEFIEVLILKDMD